VFLGQRLDSVCVVGTLAPLLLPVVRLYQTADDLNVGSEREVLQPQNSLCLCLLTGQLETMKYIGKFSSVNWEIITVRGNGSTLAGLLPLKPMGALMMVLLLPQKLPSRAVISRWQVCNAALLPRSDKQITFWDSGSRAAP